MLTVKHLMILSLIYFQGDAWVSVPFTIANKIKIKIFIFQRSVKLKYLNINNNYAKHLGAMNATLLDEGKLFFYVRPFVDAKQVFLQFVLKFSADDSDIFNIDFINKTIDFCRL